MSVAAMLAIHPETRAALESFERTPSHAVALIGNPGLGKTLLARAMAQQMLGTTSVELANYPYFRAITPQEGTISITQIREIRSFFTLTIPSRAKRAIARVLLVEDADTMTREAQNAFLKLLEEPPEDTVCILTLAKPQRLLATVRSRLQKIQVHKPHVEDVLKSFEPLNRERPEVERALLLAGGNISAAYNLLTDTATAAADTSVELVKSTLSADAFTRLAMVDGLIADRTAAVHYVDTLIVVAQASLHQAAGGDATRLNRWHRVLQAAQQAQTALAKKGNLKLVFTELMLSL